MENIFFILMDFRFYVNTNEFNEYRKYLVDEENNKEEVNENENEEINYIFSSNDYSKNKKHQKQKCLNSKEKKEEGKIIVEKKQTTKAKKTTNN